MCVRARIRVKPIGNILFRYSADRKHPDEENYSYFFSSLYSFVYIYIFLLSYLISFIRLRSNHPLRARTYHNNITTVLCRGPAVAESRLERFPRTHDYNMDYIDIIIMTFWHSYNKIEFIEYGKDDAKVLLNSHALEVTFDSIVFDLKILNIFLEILIQFNLHLDSNQNHRRLLYLMRDQIQKTVSWRK